MQALQILIELGLMAVLIIGIIRVLARSGKVVSGSEVGALRSNTQYANSVVGADDPRKYYVRLMNFKLIGYAVNAPVVLVEPEELAVLAPFIDDRIRQNMLLGKDREAQTAALETFKQRMIQKGVWPQAIGPEVEITTVLNEPS
jgi:hypothetical protein